MKNKINKTHKHDIYKIFAGSVLLFGLIIYCIFYFLSSDINEKTIITFTFDFILIILFALLLLFYANKSYCWIYIEDEYIKRKGFFFGYKKEVKLSEIKDVVLYKDRFYIIENESEHNDPKDFQECIHFIKDDNEHYAFLESFWANPIKEYDETLNENTN